MGAIPDAEAQAKTYAQDVNRFFELLHARHHGAACFQLGPQHRSGAEKRGANVDGAVRHDGQVLVAGGGIAEELAELAGHKGLRQPRQAHQKQSLNNDQSHHGNFFFSNITKEHWPKLAWPWPQAAARDAFA